jgi:transcriptional regulator with XRE-family HTH domain
MPYMTDNTQPGTPTPWLALRTATGLSQREVERRLGWDKRGHLSLIERGLPPTPEQAQQLRAFYATALIGERGEA